MKLAICNSYFINYFGLFVPILCERIAPKGHNMLNKIAAAILSLAATLLLFGVNLAYADGMTIVPSATYTRPVSCYVKLYGTGEFVQHRVNIAGADLDGLGANSMGISPQVGCDVSSNLFFAGVFTDYTWNKASVKISAGAPVLSVPMSNDWAIGGRIGVNATPHTRIYGLVAYAGAQESASMSTFSLGLNGPKGVAIGGGIEVDLGRGLNATLEYRHTAFDTNTTTLLPMTFDTVQNSVRAGVGYRF